MAHGVVGGIAEARVFPEGVGRRRYVALDSAHPSERGEMLVGNAVGGERSGEDVAVELRIEARARNGPHIDDQLDLGGGQERRELFDRPGRMSDRVERVCQSTARSLSAPLAPLSIRCATSR